REEMEQRVRSRPEVRKRRTQLVAHPCGTMQRWWDAGSCFMRGLEKVQAELSVTVWAYNLRRGLKIIGRPRLLAALGRVGRVVGRAALAEVQATLWPARWPERHTERGRYGRQCGWAA